MNRDIVNTAPATRLTIADAYFQDDFRATSKLTLNLALRWDLITMYNDVNNHQSNLNLGTGLLDVATAGNRGPNVNTNYKQLRAAHRLRLSVGNGRTVIRGAWGITNFPDHYGAAGGTLERNWPWFEEYVLGQQTANTPWAALSSPKNLPNPSCAPNNELVPDRTAGLCAAAVRRRPWSHRPRPASTMFRSTTSRTRPPCGTSASSGKLTPTSTIDVAYVGTKGSNLFRSINIDQAFPGAEHHHRDGSAGDHQRT